MFRFSCPSALRALCCVVACFASAPALTAQEPPAAKWQFMQDGIVFADFNRQGGSRGGKEFIVPNWWMGMAARSVGKGMVTLTGMFSLDPATLGKDGYREIFQVGEVLNGLPLIDHQHPHDLFMQLAAIWRIPITAGTGFTIAGAPAGEPALGPVAFMHRPSASENPFAPLSHHVFDSTHISFGVVTAAADHGPWAIEGSVFNGREPDDNRWNFDFGALDSVSGRVWFRPTDRWEFQVSTGHLRDPEELEPGDVERTTASGSWFLRDGDDYTAVTVAYGVNATDHGRRHAVLGEATKHSGLNSLYARAEVLQVETAVLQPCCASVPSGGVISVIPCAPLCGGADPNRRDVVGAFTFGGVRDVLRRRGFEGGFGGAVTFYAVPGVLTSTHGEHPVSFQLFFRLRPPATEGMGRMWNMRMSQPMAGHMHHQ
jgi:hypothetical protein